MDARIYERIITTNGRPLKWNANPVFVRKPSQIQPRLIFNYHFIFENIPASHMEAVTTVYDLLNILSNPSLFSTDIKHGY